MCPSKAPDPGLLHEAIRGVGGANSGKLQGGPRRRGRAALGAGGPIAPRPGYWGVAVPTGEPPTMEVMATHQDGHRQEACRREVCHLGEGACLPTLLQPCLMALVTTQMRCTLLHTQGLVLCLINKAVHTQTRTGNVSGKHNFPSAKQKSASMDVTTAT